MRLRNGCSRGGVVSARSIGHRMHAGTTRALRLAVIAGLFSAAPVAATTITVSSPADTLGAGSGCTLRDALVLSNAPSNPALKEGAEPGGSTGAEECSGTASGSGAPYTVVLEAGQTYELTAIDDYWFGPDGLPPVSAAVTIQGDGARIVRSSVGGTPAFRFFYVSGGLSGIPGGELTLQDLTLSNGLAQGGSADGGGGGAGMGGAIFDQGRATLERDTLSGNVAQGGSGASGGTAGAGIGQNSSNGSGGGFGGPAPGANGGAGGPAGKGGSGEEEGEEGGGGGGGFHSGQNGGANSGVGSRGAGPAESATVCRSRTRVRALSLILRRFGMPDKVIAERQFNLSFLNTAVDALALIVFGAALAAGVVTGDGDLSLTLPSALAASGIAVALLIARRASTDAERLKPKKPKIAAAISTLADAVEDTRQLVFHRGSWRSVLGIVAYLGFDVLVLWSAFFAVHAHPFPALPVVVMAYIIGALGGSVPLPASAGTIGGIAGMLVLYGVAHNAAVAAVLLHQAIGLLVPLTGGAIAYMVLRRRLRPKPGQEMASEDSTSPPDPHARHFHGWRSDAGSPDVEDFHAGSADAGNAQRRARG